MRGLMRNPWLFGLGVLLAVLVVAGGNARADVTTDLPGSVIIFPKVVADSGRDTIIQITNTSFMTTTAHCIYVDSSGTCSLTQSLPCNLDSDCPSSPAPESCVHVCTEDNFDIFLTAQQPTVWQVSLGRAVDPNDMFPGFDPGRVPPKRVTQTDHFFGELKCIQTDATGAPSAQNSLKGEAVLFGDGFGDISEYNALAIQAASGQNKDNDLQLNGKGVCAGGVNSGKACSPATAPTDCPGSTCTSTGEYNACPRSLILNHFGEGATDEFTGAIVHTELTLVPCTEDLEDQVPTHGRALFSLVTEMEQPLSAEIKFDCMSNRRLTDISSQFNFGMMGTDFFKTRISAPKAVCANNGTECQADSDCPGSTCNNRICYSGDQRCHFCTQNDPDPNCTGPNGPLPIGTEVGTCNCTSNADCPNFKSTPDGTPLGCRPWSGLLGVAEEFQQPDIAETTPGTAAVNLHTEGSRPGDVIVVPTTKVP